MSHIDTLQVYEDLKASGFDDIKAKAQVKSLDEAFNGLDAVRKAELDYSISRVINSIELLKKDFSILKWFVVGVGSLVALPILEKLLNLIR